MSTNSQAAHRSAATPGSPGQSGMNNAFKVATIRGIQIYVHWTWLIALFFFTWSLGAYYDTTFNWGHGTAYLVGAISTVLLFITVLLHELGHSFTARSLGLPVNSITLFIFGGVSNLTTEPQSPRVEFLVSFAGPLTSLILSGIFYLLHAAAGTGSSSEVSAVLGYLASVNLILAIFNLIPAFPLDGGRVFRSLVWWITGSMRQATRIATSISRIIAYLFIAAGLVETLVGGNFVGGIWLAFIGWFLYNSASVSGQQAVLDQMLQGVDVADVMDPAPPAIAPTTPVQSLVFDHLLDQGHRAVAVQSPDGSLLGLATLSDLRQVRQDDWGTTPVSEIMTPAARLVTVTPSEDLRQAVQLLATNQYHQLPVIDTGKLAGLLNRDHVLQFLQLRQVQSRQDGSGSAGGGTPAEKPPRQLVG